MVKKNSPITFFKESMSDIRQTGSVAPSSSHLARLLVAPIIPAKNLCIVELGAGTGSVTKNIISILQPDSVLLVFENNPKMFDHLNKRFDDPRVHIICDDAQNIADHLKVHGKSKADYIVSGLPISNMSSKVRRSILESVRDNLKSDGIFTQFQYFLTSIVSIRRLFNIENISFEWRNIPPAFVYRCKIK